MERQAASSLTAGAKPAAAFALMASAAQPALKEARSMSGPLKTPELTPLPSTKHAIGGGTVQVLRTPSSGFYVMLVCLPTVAIIWALNAAQAVIWRAAISTPVVVLTRPVRLPATDGSPPISKQSGDCLSSGLEIPGMPHLLLRATQGEHGWLCVGPRCWVWLRGESLGLWECRFQSTGRATATSGEAVSPRAMAALLRPPSATAPSPATPSSSAIPPT